MSETKTEKEMFEKEKLDEVVERILEIMRDYEKRAENATDPRFCDWYNRSSGCYKNVIRIINDKLGTNYSTEKETENE
jgi:hypothetical protein